MSERKNIGQILKDLGRLTEDDIERALEYQRTQGGLFGQALLALGLLESEELEWSLAAQFDLPYIFPDAAAIDPAVAGLVSMEWALRHNALPIMRDGRRLTLVVDSPLHIDAPTELADITDCEVDLALATPAAIRRVIREVFWGNRTRNMSLANASAMPVSRFLDKVARSGYRQWGISERPDRAIGWYLEAGEQKRFRLSGSCREELDRHFDPPAGPYLERSGRQTWKARLSGEHLQLELTAIVSDGALELSVRGEPGSEQAPGRYPSAELMAELRQTLSDGIMVVGVEQPEDEWTSAVLARIPEGVLPAGHRAMFFSVQDGSGGTGLPEMPISTLASEDEWLRQFSFDALIIERALPDSPALGRAMQLAPLVVIGLDRGNAATTIPEEVDALLSWTPGNGGDSDGEAGWSLRLRREQAENPTT